MQRIPRIASKLRHSAPLQLQTAVLVVSATSWLLAAQQAGIVCAVNRVRI
jgi:hypothetical protein